MNGKVALITGGTKGIGLGIAEALLEQGVRVAITGRSQEGCDKAVDTLKSRYEADVLGIACDVRSGESQRACVQQILANWGQLDVVIANAGIGHFASIEDMTEEQWNETIDVNLTGVFHTIKNSVDALKQSKGYFMTIASLAGTNFFAKGAAYNASKFGLVGFTQAVMLDLRNAGIKTTTIMPGSVSSYFGGRTPSDGADWRIQPEDLGQMVVDLLRMHPRTLPSKVEVRPSIPPSK